MPCEISLGTCEHCCCQFEYWLCHCGFGECVYSYCDSCGRTAILSLWDKRMPNLANCPGQQGMCAEMEKYLLPCECGGTFRADAAPRCTHCNERLSAEQASSYIEANAPGTDESWWQRNWRGIYCIVINDRRVDNNFR